MGSDAHQTTAELTAKFRPLIEAWSNAWDIPTSIVLAICEIESSFRPGVKNMLAASQGGAWGLMQVTATTAETLVHGLKRTGSLVTDMAHAQAREVIDERWRQDDPTCLLDPELNVMLGSHYLARFSWEFGADIERVAVAYHNGAGFLRGFLSGGGKAFPKDLPPKASAYAAKAKAAQRRYSDEDKTPRPQALRKLA